MSRAARHRLALRVVEKRRGRLLDQLLVAPLQRAVARADHDHVTVPVGEDLRLDVARPIQELLDEALAAAERRRGLAHRRGVELGHLVHAPRDLQAAATAAKRRLDRDRQTMRGRKGHGLLGAVHRPVGARHQRRAHPQRDGARGHLVAERGHGLGARTDPDQTRIQHRLRELGALGEKAVARVHRIGAALSGDGQQLVDGEIGLGWARAFERPGLVGGAHMQRVGVRVGIDGDRTRAVIAAGAGHPDGDFAPVGDQYFADHHRPPQQPGDGPAKSPWPAAQARRCAETPAARLFSPRLAIGTF